MSSQQQFIPGTEPPGRNEDVEAALERWYEAKALQKEAAEVTAVRHASVVEAAIEAGIDLYPFLEPETGRRKVLDVTAVRRARVKRRASEKQEAADREFDAGARAPAGVTMSVRVGDGPAVVVDAEKLASVSKRKPLGEVTGSVASGRAGKGR